MALNFDSQKTCLQLRCFRPVPRPAGFVCTLFRFTHAGAQGRFQNGMACQDAPSLPGQQDRQEDHHPRCQRNGQFTFYETDAAFYTLS